MSPGIYIYEVVTGDIGSCVHWASKKGGAHIHSEDQVSFHLSCYHLADQKQ